MAVITPEMVREYSKLEQEYPDHNAPLILTDANGAAALVFITDAPEDLIDCPCGESHDQYAPILPWGPGGPGTPGASVLRSPFTGGLTVRNTVGEGMIGLFPFDSMEVREVVAEDWPDSAELEAFEADSLSESLIESDPWLDFPF